MHTQHTHARTHTNSHRTPNLQSNKHTCTHCVNHYDLTHKSTQHTRAHAHTRTHTRARTYDHMSQLERPRRARVFVMKCREVCEWVCVCVWCVCVWCVCVMKCREVDLSLQVNEGWSDRSPQLVTTKRLKITQSNFHEKLLS